MRGSMNRSIYIALYPRGSRGVAGFGSLSHGGEARPARAPSFGKADYTAICLVVAYSSTRHKTANRKHKTANVLGRAQNG